MSKSFDHFTTTNFWSRWLPQAYATLILRQRRFLLDSLIFSTPKLWDMKVCRQKVVHDRRRYCSTLCSRQSTIRAFRRPSHTQSSAFTNLTPGAGYVQKVGPGVTTAKAGDPVLLSFSHCGKCDLCKTGRPAYCLNFAENIAGATDVYEDIGGPEQGQFYGQSSFSSLSIVKEASVVNVRGLVKNDDELKLFAPLSCGLQTGAGAVMILGQATAADVLVVMGLGEVGLGCIMAAKIAGCKMVVGVDKVEGRMNLARSLGATEVIIRDISADAASFATDLLKVTNGERVSIVIDTTGDPSVMTAGMASLGKRGKYIQVGVPPADFNMTLAMSHFFHNSNILMGCIMGDAVPREFIPQMIEWHRDGKFPLEKLTTLMPVREFSKALAGLQSGELIKPVLVW